MVRSTAISWKVGLAVTAVASLPWQLPARADDRPEDVEIRSQPLEQKAVPVTLLPAASDTVFTSWRPWKVEGATIVMVRPAEKAAIAQPLPEQAEPAPVTAPPAENAPIAQPRAEPVEAAPSIRVRSAAHAAIDQPPPKPVEAAPIIVGPAEKAAIIQPPLEPVDGAPSIMVLPAAHAAIAQPRPGPVEAAPVMAQPAETAAIVQPRAEPEKIQEDAARVEAPAIPERRPRVALLPPAGNAPAASPRADPAKTQSDATLVAIPSLPGRSPFRPAPFKSEIVESGPNAPAGFRAPEPPKGNAASRFLANLWPGNKGASTPVSSTGARSPSSTSDGGAGSRGPSTASAEGQTESGQRGDKPPIKRFLDGIQFWKN
jgi:hypothetical protein